MTFVPAYNNEQDLIINPGDNMKFTWTNKKLLIIEDDYVSFLYLKDVLSETKIRIKRAVSLKKAQNFLASKNKIDLIIANVNLLGPNIYKSILEIKSYNQLIPIIAITSQYSIDTQTECIEAGCDTYIYSNIDSSQLLFSIDEILDRSMIINSLILKDRS